ncbi:MAG: response regulator transcription factor [Betaproteobacteria bacterium]|nr:response regulator transcription factor [Betaproteobacteria bacterium]
MASKPVKAGSTSRSALKVAVVEDAENIRQRLVQLVTDIGTMRVVGEAATEENAIAVCRQQLPEALILDMQLADGSGLGVLKAMDYAAQPSRPAVIVLTNFPSPAVERAARDLGAEWFLDKSSEFYKLPQLLQLVADRRPQPI